MEVDNVYIEGVNNIYFPAWLLLSFKCSEVFYLDIWYYYSS